MFNECKSVAECKLESLIAIQHPVTEDCEAVLNIRTITFTWFIFEW